MKLTNKKPKFIKPLKVLSATALSLSLLMGIAPSGHAFDTDKVSQGAKTKQEVLKTQKETKGFTAKQQVAYYNKQIAKIVKDSKKYPTKELQLFAMYVEVLDTLAPDYDDAVGKTPYKKYKHKNAGVNAINSGVGKIAGYNQVVHDVLKKSGYESYIIKSKKGEEEWVQVKFGKSYYYLHPHHSDYEYGDGVQWFMYTDEGMKDTIPGFFLNKNRRANEYEHFSGFHRLNPKGIIKKTDKYYYSLSKWSISKVSFTGKATDIYKLGDYEEFIAKKGNTFYFFARKDWNSPSMTIYKTTLDNPTKRTKVSETKEGNWSISNGKLTIKDNNKKKIVLKVDKDGSLY